MRRIVALVACPFAAWLVLAAAAPARPGAPLFPERSDVSAKDKARIQAVTRPTTDFTKPERFEAMSGGAGTTTAPVNADSFSHFSTNITFEEEEQFKLGNALFRKFWVSAPSSTQASDGLGPFFNARSCQSCHLKDGRGKPPEGGETLSMFLRLALSLIHI